MWKAIMVEIKNSIFKSGFHVVRFFGLLLIPLIYGFSYIFAFYDPFVHTDKLKVAVITERHNGTPDAFGNALGKELSKKQELHVGDLEMNMKMEHLYSDQVDLEEVKKDHFATIVVPDMTNDIATIMSKFAVTRTTTSVLGKISDAMEIAKQISARLRSGTHISLYTNNKKNYLIAFGIDVGMSMTGSLHQAASASLNAIGDPTFKSIVQAKAGANFDSTKYDSIVKELSELNKIKTVEIESHGYEKPKYGYGLAPFFICVAMWIGGMVMTFAVHRKIYDTEATPTQRYFAKWCLINFGTVVQATILMVALYIIGFDELGLDHWGMMYGFAIVIGMTSSSIIQAIRFSIYDRNIGIFCIIVLLVLQMASGGGLFPIETQSGFYRVLNKILPMGHGVPILREASVDTDWAVIGKEWGIMFSYLIFVPIGVWINHRRTIALYIEKGIPLPEKIQNSKIYKKKLAKKAGDK